MLCVSCLSFRFACLLFVGRAAISGLGVRIVFHLHSALMISPSGSAKRPLVAAKMKSGSRADWQTLFVVLKSVDTIADSEPFFSNEKKRNASESEGNGLSQMQRQYSTGPKRSDCDGIQMARTLFLLSRMQQAL